MLKINNDSYKYKNVDSMYSRIQTYSRIKFSDVPLFLLYVVTSICKQTSSLASKFSIQKIKSCKMVNSKLK